MISATVVPKIWTRAPLSDPWDQFVNSKNDHSDPKSQFRFKSLSLLSTNGTFLWTHTQFPKTDKEMSKNDPNYKHCHATVVNKNTHSGRRNTFTLPPRNQSCGSQMIRKSDFRGGEIWNQHWPLHYPTPQDTQRYLELTTSAHTALLHRDYQRSEMSDKRWNFVLTKNVWCSLPPHPHRLLIFLPWTVVKNLYVSEFT